MPHGFPLFFDSFYSHLETFPSILTTRCLSWEDGYSGSIHFNISILYNLSSQDLNLYDNYPQQKDINLLFKKKIIYILYSNLLRYHRITILVLLGFVIIEEVC